MRRVAASFVVAAGLLSAAPDFDTRLPELYSGDGRGTVPVAVPYPAACRPQAWAAASAVVLLQSALGLRPDVPGGRLGIHPPAHGPFGSVHATGLQVAGQPLSVHVAADGELLDAQVPAPIELA